MTESFLYTDCETRSTVPIQRGNDLYTRNADCLIVTYARDERPGQVWEPWDDPRIPTELEDAVEDERVAFVAHNSPFDENIYDYALQITVPTERWRDTRSQAYAHGLPGALETLGVVLDLPQDQQKLVDDKYLINTFCIPDDYGNFIQPYDRPDDWARFVRYAARDTDALRAIHKKLATHNYSGEHLRMWWLDQRINRRGFKFDAAQARHCVDFLHEAKKITDKTMSDATVGAVTAATQRNRLLEYLQKKCGLNIPTMRASEIRDWLEHDDLEPGVRLLLETRLEASKSSGSKYNRGLTIMSPDERIRWSMQFNGAGRTGRTSGKGFQPHNMARPVITVRREKTGEMELVPVKAKYIDEVILPGIASREALRNNIVFGGPNEATALALRHVITAGAGNELVVADWSNIESRILAWIANEVWKLEAYRAVDRGEGVDLYKLLFSQFFGTNVEDVNDNERQSGKVSELAFGFGGGVGALVTMSAGYQMDLTPLADLVLPRAKPEHIKKAERNWRRAALLGEDYELEPPVYKACDILKQTYRESNTAIDQLKHDIDKAVKGSIKTPGRSFRVARCRIWSTKTWLIIELPSGRRLLYANTAIRTEKDIDPDTGKPIFREVVTYATARGKSWRRERAWSGLFVENIVQAIANDVLRAALLRLDEDTQRVSAVASFLATLPVKERTAISLHVHDEAVLDVPVGSYPLLRMIQIMIKDTDWSVGLPLAAEGWHGFRYGKREGKKYRDLLHEAAKIEEWAA